jgi:hypothetical protein
MGFFEQVSNAELCVYEAERLKEFADKANKPADPIVLLISAKKTKTSRIRFSTMSVNLFLNRRTSNIVNCLSHKLTRLY